MASDFLQGFQAGANLFAQAKQLQEARQAYMLEAEQKLASIRAAQGMEQLRLQQMKLARAKEEREAQEWQQQQALEQQRQQFAPFVQRRFQELQGATPRGLEPGATVEETDPLLRRAVMEGLIQYGGRPQDVVSMLGQDELTRRDEARIQSREAIAESTDKRLRELFDEKDRATQRRFEETEKRLRESEERRQKAEEESWSDYQKQLAAAARERYKQASGGIMASVDSSVEKTAYDQLQKELQDISKLKGVEAPSGSLAPQTSFMWDNKILDLVPVK